MAGKSKSGVVVRTRGRVREEGAEFPIAPPCSEVPKDYAQVLSNIKERIQRERLHVVLSANSAMVLMYWDIGRTILERQERAGWGAKIIDRLSADLREAYPEMKGFSLRNLKYMRAFAAAWPIRRFVQQAAAQIPWFHNCVLLDRLEDAETRKWYIQATLAHGWSRPVLEMQIDVRVHQRQGKAVNNFKATLPPADSDMAEQIFKDPYLFDFVGTADRRREREVERALVNHIQRFLIELGKGFAFVGSQVHLCVADQDYYLDLLFYHVKLHCYVVIELKEERFKPEHTGKMNFYLSAVDDLLRAPEDGPTIGLLLCRTKRHFEVEYALRNVNKPIGVASWETEIVEKLPENLKSSLPTVEEIEGAELGIKKIND